MPFTPDLVTAVIASLNRKNAVPVARRPNPANMQLVSVTPRNDEVLDVVIQGKPAYPMYGRITAQVHRQNIADYFSKVNLKAVPTRKTVYELLDDLNGILGVTFTQWDVEDAPITWADGKATVVLKSKSTGWFWYGTATLNVVNGDVPLSTAYPVVAMTLPNKAYNKEQWAAQYSTASVRTLDLNKVDVSAPQLPADLGLTSNYNSVVVLTAKPNSGFTGTQNVFFSRYNLSALEGLQTAVSDDFAGSLYDALAQDNIGLRAACDVSQVQDQVLGTDWPKAVKLVPTADSYKVMGSANISVVRYSDDEKEFTINITTNTRGTSTYWQSMLGTRPRAARMKINLNIADGIWMTRDSNTYPTIPIDEMSQFGEVVWNITNRGYLVGAGGAGVTWPFTMANKPFDGADAIRVADNFRGRVIINNYGTISGGGGGGDECDSSTTIGGNGGVPYGLGATPGHGSTKVNGLTTGFSATPVDAIQRNTNYTGYRNNLTNGKGGGLGQPGRYAAMDQYNTPGGTDVFNYGRDEGMSFTYVGNGGKALTGKTSVVSWVNKGTVIEDGLSEYDNFLDWLATQDVGYYTDDKKLTDVTDTTKPVVVTPDGFIITSGTSYQKIKPTNKMYLQGSPYGSAVAGTANTTLLGLLAHCLPDFDTLNNSYYNNRKMLFVLTPTTPGAVTASVRNRVSASANTTATQPRFFVQKCIYFDAYLGQMMECNPYTKAAPVRWVRPTN